MNIPIQKTDISEIKDGPKPKELLFFHTEQVDDLSLNNVHIHTSTFYNIGLKGSKINNSSFTQSHWENVYFRGATFKNVQFTGSSFKSCNFKKSSFQSCDFKYCSFYMCDLPIDEIRSCLPAEPNLRRDLARILRINAESLGEKRNADIFLDIEIQSTEQTDKEIFFSKTKYYKDTYDSISRLHAGWKFISSKLSGAIWGYGHRFSRLLISYFTISIAFSAIKYWGKIEFSLGTTTTRLSFLESIYATLSQSVGFQTQSNLPVSLFGKSLLYCEHFTFTIYLALLAATFYRKIAR